MPSFGVYEAYKACWHTETWKPENAGAFILLLCYCWAGRLGSIEDSSPWMQLEHQRMHIQWQHSDYCLSCHPLDLCSHPATRFWNRLHRLPCYQFGECTTPQTLIYALSQKPNCSTHMSPRKGPGLGIEVCNFGPRLFKDTGELKSSACLNKLSQECRLQHLCPECLYSLSTVSTV